ncbi:helix-turn-helix domain-containing protein [Streptomyces sp. PSKA30]|uniref:helix-turn-helix domain-containing protein n=1 Tax=Streptomyces sp. PSKA30 TaxID=2874597 RepID=UPI0035B08560
MFRGDERRTESGDAAALLARSRPTGRRGLSFRPGSRRTAGLPREEVAWLAGVSPDYVKRLEQARAHPSGAVLRALARTLRLSDAECEPACRLAGHAAEGGGRVPQYIGPSVQRLTDTDRTALGPIRRAVA